MPSRLVVSQFIHISAAVPDSKLGWNGPIRVPKCTVLYKFLVDLDTTSFTVVIVNNPLCIPEGISPQLKNLLEGLLCKDPDKRIGLEAVAAHPWVVEEGPIPRYLCICKRKSFQGMELQESRVDANGTELLQSGNDANGTDVSDKALPAREFVQIQIHSCRGVNLGLSPTVCAGQAGRQACSVSVKRIATCKQLPQQELSLCLYEAHRNLQAATTAGIKPVLKHPIRLGLDEEII
ncbi:hypothetical protein ACLOJK_011581 [Asimina triloba]